VLCGFLALGFVAGQAIAEPPVVALVDAAPAVSEPTSPLVELQALKTAYEKLKANQDPSLKPLLWAGLLAVGLKTILSVLNAIWKKPKKWLAWTALIAAVPIALLAHYAGGNGLLASIVVAGGGPGAILVHELLKLVTEKKAEA
jgi:hypothetical protein